MTFGVKKMAPISSFLFLFSVQLLFCLYNLFYCTLQSDLSTSWTLLKDIIIALSPNSFPLSEIGGPQNTVSASLNYRRTGMIQSGTVIAEDVDRVRISQLMKWTANPQTVNCISPRKEFYHEVQFQSYWHFVASLRQL